MATFGSAARGAVAALAALAAGGAAAHGSVTLYGLFDVAVEHVTDVGAPARGLTRVPGLTGTAPSRLGLRGTEDLGAGVRAVFALENGFAPDTGGFNQGGRLFGRQAWVGLAAPWGTLSLGRQYTMLFYALLEADVMGPSLYGSGSLDPYIPNARADNALGWQGRFGGWMLGATYSFGRDVANAGPGPAGTNCPGEDPADRTACREWSALVKYDAQGFGAAAAVDTIRGAPGAFGGLIGSHLADTRIALNVYLRIAGGKLSAALIRRHNEGGATPRSDLWWIGASLPFGAVTLEGQLLRYDVKGSDDGALLPSLRARYRFSPRTAAYLAAGRIDNDGQLAVSVSAGAPGAAPAPGAAQTALALGLMHAF